MVNQICNARYLQLYRSALVFLAVWLGVCAFAIADTPVEEPVSNWHFSLGVGAGMRTNPVEYASDIPIILLPQVEYSGERFFIQNLDVGFVIIESKSQQWNLLLTPSYDQMFFDRWNSGNFFVDASREFPGTILNNGSSSEILNPPKANGENNFIDHSQLALHKRRMTALGGVEYNFSSAELDWQLQWLHDVLDVHNGSEVRFFVSKDWRQNRSRFKASLGLVWQDKNTLDYYYGLTAQEVAAENIYHTEAGTSSLLRFDWNYRLTEDWDLRLFTSYRHLGDEIQQSPLIRDDKIVTLFFGGVYHF